MSESGIVLEVSDGHRPRSELPAIQAALRELGVGVWPLDLTAAPPDVWRLLRKPALSDEEKQILLDHFLLPRERLVETIAAAGREPHVAGGGALATRVESHGYSYPQLWVVEAGADFGRFDRFHVNRSDDGVCVDEVGQILSGDGFVGHYRRDDGAVLTLRLSCPGEASGWRLTYDGGRPHIGSLSGAAPGTKVLVQVIGPPAWRIRYVDDPPPA